MKFDGQFVVGQEPFPIVYSCDMDLTMVFQLLLALIGNGGR